MYKLTYELTGEPRQEETFRTRGEAEDRRAVIESYADVSDLRLEEDAPEPEPAESGKVTVTVTLPAPEEDPDDEDT